MIKEALFVLAAILGIIIPIITFLVTREKLFEFFKNIRNYRTPSKGRILELENNYFRIEHKEFLNDSKELKKNRYVFLPVVPTDSPNLIHAIFIRYLRDLSKARLKTIVFVFDYYYAVISKHSIDDAGLELPHRTLSECEQFIVGLEKLGLKDCRHVIIRESQLMERKKYSRIVLKMIHIYLGDISIVGLERISEGKHLRDKETTAIRYFKPALVMIYFYVLLSKYPIGFTFSGLDEQKLWNTFKVSLKDSRKIRLTNFYIPILPKLCGGRSDVLDKIENITINDSINDIKDKLSKCADILDKKGLVGMALDILVFSKSDILKIETVKNGNKEYNNLDEIIIDYSDGTITKERLISTISQKIHNLLAY